MNRIKELRKKHNLTQEELGAIINVQKSAVSKYELGRAVPSTDVLNKLAPYFKVSIDYLLGNDTEPQPTNGTVQASTLALTSQERDLLAAYRQSDSTHRTLAMDALKAGCMPPQAEVIEVDENGNLYLTEEELQKYNCYYLQGKLLCSIESTLYEVEKVSDGLYMLKPFTPLDPNPRKPLDPKPRKKQQEVKEDIADAA